MSLVECIPNVSEGRRADVLDALAEVFVARDEVRLLHVHPDIDHNRTVYTVVGEPTALLESIEELYAQAVNSIDLRLHHGVHPRVGAVDVCPFIPLPEHGSSMDECVELARQLGERVASRHDLPVWLYQEAATAEPRHNLSTIRDGQFEGLADKLADPDWRPAFGPPRPHPTAGATVIGARGPLVAYNVVLDSSDVEIARQVAAVIRASSGGLPGIKAMGVTLGSRDLVQVSMNVEDPERTPVHVAFAHVREAAAAHGVEVLETELVGLATSASLRGAGAALPPGPDPDPDRVVEDAIDRAFAM